MSIKNVWIINEYAGHPDIGMEYRHYYLSKEWVNIGLKVFIFTSSYSHLFKSEINSQYQLIDGINYIFVKTINYGKSQSIQRVIKWFLFFVKCFFFPFFKADKPDVIIVSPMATFCIIPAWVLAKFYKAKFVFEVKDIWPLSIVKIGNLSRYNPLIFLMKICEWFGIRQSDYLVSNLQNYGQYLTDNKINKNFFWISNGAEIQDYVTFQKIASIDTENFTNKMVIAYTGTIGLANCLEYFCEAAKIMSANKDILFLIVGNGQEKNKLVEQYNDLPNLKFISQMSKTEVRNLLENVSACYIGLKNEPLFKYGVSPNKLFDYMNAGKPIVYAIDSGKNIVDKYNCGIVVSPEDPNAIAAAVNKLYNMKIEERERLGNNGRMAVQKHFSYKVLAMQFIKTLNDEI